MKQENNKFLKLEKYFDVFIGINRNQYKNDNNTIKAYQYNFVKNIDGSFLIDELNEYQEILNKPVEEKFFLKKSDILIRLIGEVGFYYLNLSPFLLLPTSSFCVIRLKSNFDDLNFSCLDLWAYLNSIYFKKWSSKLFQTNFYTANLKISDIKNFSINLKEINSKKTKLFFNQQKFNNLIQKKTSLINELINYELMKG